jgi:hypothetical protein
VELRRVDCETDRRIVGQLDAVRQDAEPAGKRQPDGGGAPLIGDHPELRGQLDGRPARLRGPQVVDRALPAAAVVVDVERAVAQTDGIAVLVVRAIDPRTRTLNPGAARTTTTSGVSPSTIPSCPEVYPIL